MTDKISGSFVAVGKIATAVASLSIEIGDVISAIHGVLVGTASTEEDEDDEEPEESEDTEAHSGPVYVPGTTIWTQS